MFRKFHFFLLILLLSSIFSFTYTFANEDGGLADDIVIPEDILDYPLIEGPEQIEGIPEFQRDPEVVIGSPDFEKMRDLPTDSQDYQLGRKVCWIRLYARTTNRFLGTCTGFLVGPDLLMTAAHCFYDTTGSGRLQVGRALILMDYYQDLTVDRTAGGVTTSVRTILAGDGPKDYVLLRLADPIGETYGYLQLDTTTVPDTSQSVKIIQHPQGRSKEISRRNSQISDLLPDTRARFPFLLLYFADTEAGSSGSPVFLKDGSGVIAIHHVGFSRNNVPLVNIGSLMSHIVPEIQQYLPPVLAFSPGTIADQTFTVGTAVSLSLPVATGGTAPYTYTLSPIPAGLSFHPTTRILSGTPTTAGTTSATYTATDAANASASLTFTITAQGKPTFNPPTIGDQTFTVGTSVSLTLPVATGGTPPYTYTLSPTPAGISFNPTTRVLSGTPTTAGTTSATYTATDAANASASLTFTIEVTEDTEVPADDKMYWIDSGTDKIQRADLIDGANIEDIVTTGLRTPSGIALDLTGNKVYWIDAGTDKIQRADPDGSNIEDIVTTGLRTPTDIALDLTGNKVYWIDAGTDKIQRANLDGSNIEDIVTTGLRTPTDIALDLKWGKVYWVDSGTDKVQRANLDGSNIEDIITTELRTPTGIAVDMTNDKVYWTDSGTDKIQRANLDGSNVQDIVTTGLGTPTDIAVDSDGKVYWIDSGTDKIQRANLDGSNIEDIVTTGLRTPTGLALGIPQVVPTRPPGPGPGGGAVDVNADGQVTVIDLAIVALFYGTQVPDGVDLPADVNDDGTVDILDLTAVAQAIDAAGNSSTLSADDVEAVLEAIADIEAIPEAPATLRSSISRHALLSGNVAAAFADAKHLTTEDARLRKWMPMLKELLHLLTEMREIPETTALLPNYPNPFNPETWIPYQLAKSAEVTLTIHDVRGALVRELTLGHQAAGVYESRARAAYWDGRNAVGEPVASGLYFYTLTAGDFTATRKMLIAK